MMNLESYLALGATADSLAASALVADRCDHAMAGAVVLLAELADKQDALGHVFDGAIIRRASRWLQAETEAHRKVADELVKRSGYGDAFVELLKERRAASIETREAMRPLFEMAGGYLRLALKRAALDEASESLAKGDMAGVKACRAALDFLAAIREPGNVG